MTDKKHKTTKENQEIIEETEKLKKQAQQQRSNMVEITKKEYDELKHELKQLQEQKDKFLRSIADYENAKKRLEKEKQDFMKFANQTLVTNLLPVIDNFERALDSAKDSKNTESVIEGITMIKEQFLDILKEAGLEKIKAKGEKFDPNFHEAIAFLETDEFKQDSVAEVLQTGYTFKERLLRPSVVKVAKKLEK